MAKAYDLDENPGMNEEFDFIPYGDTAIEFGPFTVTAREVVHPVTAYALRVEAGGRTPRLLRRQRRLPRRSTTPRATPTCSCARPRSSRARRTRPTCT